MRDCLDFELWVIHSGKLRKASAPASASPESQLGFRRMQQNYLQPCFSLTLNPLAFHFLQRKCKKNLNLHL